MCGKHGINKVAMMQNGIVLVRFDSAEGKNEVIQGSIYHFDNKPLIVKAWDTDMEFNRDELYSVPIWLKLPGLDFKYWSAKGLSKLGSLIGKPLMVDINTEKKVGLNFARMLVEVKIDSPLSEIIKFRNERGNIIEQRVTYEWKPSICKVCKQYGHTEEQCRRNKQTAPVGGVKEAEIVQRGGKEVQTENNIVKEVTINEQGQNKNWNRGGGWRRQQGGKWQGENAESTRKEHGNVTKVDNSTG
ncbi:uncharacterized protein LOC132061578 [Lycium ferocissimum]|uniref:uncharacterized protein LOC132061578 n=1 Tax=Lycium ferocissimum TaxID=112874 RepID=UPI002815355F|nr:uncharacterized protein LOC132061578 [Lycium ferocissimum]